MTWGAPGERSAEDEPGDQRVVVAVEAADDPLTREPHLPGPVGVAVDVHVVDAAPVGREGRGDVSAERLVRRHRGVAERAAGPADRPVGRIGARVEVVVAGADDPTDAVAELTARERQVLDLIAEGLSNKQIGERLYISGKTASVHVSAILRKLGASSRTEAVFLARVAR